MRVNINMLLSLVLTLVAAPLSAQAVSGCFSKKRDEVVGAPTRYEFKCEQLRLDRVPKVGAPHKNQTVLLSLKQNAISAVDNDAFIGMTMLEELDLESNQVASVQPDAFVSNIRLRTLSLSNNRLEQVPTSAFGRTPDLSDLNLSHNRLQTITNSDFQYLTKLQRLLLSYNAIWRVEPLAFKDMHELAFLNLAGNRIQSLQPIMQRAMPLLSLQALLVHDNPWLCDCNTRWVFLHAARSGASVPQCAGPERVRARTWNQMNEHDFACPPDVRRQSGDDNGTLEVVRGFAVTLSCAVHSDPPGLNDWYRNGERVLEDARVRLAGRPLHGTLAPGSNLTYYSDLKILDAAVNDSAVYTCQTVNQAGSSAANVTLVISEPPPTTEPSVPATLYKPDATRSREMTALHYALVACASLACIVTLISLVACAFYCTKRVLLLRYARRCRSYQPAKCHDSKLRAVAAAATPNVYAANLILAANDAEADAEEHATYRSCNFVDNYNCLDSHLNMLSEPDAHRCEYVNIVKSNDCAAYFPDVHQCNIPLPLSQKDTMIVLQQDGSACHHVLAQTDAPNHQQCGCVHYWQPNTQTQATDPDANANANCESHTHSNLSSPTANLPAPGVLTHPFNSDPNANANTPNCVFKPSITPALSTSSFSTMTVLRSNARRNNPNNNSNNPNANAYAPVASHEEERLGLSHERTASTSTFTNTNAPSRLVSNDQISLV